MKQLLHAETIIRRSVAVARHRNVALNKILKIPLSATPTSLFHEVGGKMRKAVGSDFTVKAEQHCNSVTTLPCFGTENCVVVRDSMGIMHKLHGNADDTFEVVAENTSRN